MKDRPDGVEYAAGKALFVIPKKHPLNTSVDGTAEEDRAHAAGKHEFVVQSTCWPPSLQWKQATFAVCICTVCGSCKMHDNGLLSLAPFATLSHVHM